MTEVFRLKVVSKRQVTIPQRLMQLLNIEVGDELQIEVRDRQVRALRALKVMPADLFTEDVLDILRRRAERIDEGHSIEVAEATQLEKGEPAKTFVAS